MDAEFMNIIDAIQHQQDSRGILAIMHEAISLYGFTGFIISGVPQDDLDVESAILLTGWNPAWYERYISLGYQQYDPVARHCRLTSLPFDWSDAPYDQLNDPMARQVMEEAKSFGMEAGICVPVHIEGTLQGVVSLVGNPEGLTATQRLEIHVLSLYAYGQLRYLNNQADPGATLTQREAEVLKWVAAGKTASEIADITGLSARTVNQHCENAQRRLGTSNRVHTVVEAVRRKLIVL